MLGNNQVSTSGNFRFLDNLFIMKRSYNVLQVNNDSLEKGNLFLWNFEEGGFIEKDDDILEISVKFTKNKFYPVIIEKTFNLPIEELKSSIELNNILESISKNIVQRVNNQY
ncbi:MAG: hypothetical protein ACRC1F_00540, partial [Metamycoplasmataceae bacterium]